MIPSVPRICAAALLDTAAFVVTLAGDDDDLAALALVLLLRRRRVRPGGLAACRSRAGGNSVTPRTSGPRDLLAALAAAAGRPVARSGPAAS